jgi:hypothetical protein
MKATIEKTSGYNASDSNKCHCYETRFGKSILDILFELDKARAVYHTESFRKRRFLTIPEKYVKDLDSRLWSNVTTFQDRSHIHFHLAQNNEARKINL